MPSPFRLALAAALLTHLAAACAPPDTASTDAGRDAATPIDAARDDADVDAGLPDLGAPDADLPDASVSDDAALVDAAASEDAATAEDAATSGDSGMACDTTRIRFFPAGMLMEGRLCDDVFACVPTRADAIALEAAAPLFDCSIPAEGACTGISCVMRPSLLDAAEVAQICAVTTLPALTDLVCFVYL